QSTRATSVIAAGAVIVILMLDQAVFTVCDFATGVAADRVTRTLGRLGLYVTAALSLSCLSFLALPFLAPAGAAVFLALTLVWTATSSALRAPPLMLLGKYTAKPQQPFLARLALPCSGGGRAAAPDLR